MATGDAAFAALGRETCLRRLLNSPGNFTAAKLAWVKENEPAVFDRIDRIMLPGDYVAYRMTGEVRTTVSGLSEAVLWDFERGELARFVLDHFGIPRSMIPETVPTFGPQGTLTRLGGRRAGARPRRVGELPGGRPAQQCLLAERAVAGRDRRHGGHLGRRVRRRGPAAPTIPSRG